MSTCHRLESFILISSNIDQARK